MALQLVDIAIDAKMAAPTSLSPNFCELRVRDLIALCPDWRKSIENIRFILAADHLAANASIIPEQPPSRK